VPGDVEIDWFYALSLVSLADEAGVDSLANLHQAISDLQPLFQQYPDHPGVAHCLIPATDKPGLAEQGLAAARRYAAIAPDSPHALHMPAHIFVRWDCGKAPLTRTLPLTRQPRAPRKCTRRSRTTRRTPWIF
jgi:hypothetical protein